MSTAQFMIVGPQHAVPVLPFPKGITINVWIEFATQHSWSRSIPDGSIAIKGPIWDR